MELGDSSLQFVAHDGHLDASAAEGAKGVDDAWVWSGVVPAVCDVPAFELGEDGFELGVADGSVVCTVGVWTEQGALHEVPYSVAYEGSDFGDGAGLTAVGCEGVVDGIVQVLERVEECAVEVPDDGCVFHLILFFCRPKWYSPLMTMGWKIPITTNVMMAIIRPE